MQEGLERYFCKKMTEELKKTFSLELCSIHGGRDNGYAK
jgi:hypothetical protein